MDECFREVTKDRKKAIAVSRAHASNNPFQYIENDDFFCFPISDDVVIYSAAMMFRRFHPLLPIINEKIRAIAESGFLNQWQKDSKRAGKKIKVKEGDKSHGSVQMKLRLEHVEGAFLIMLIGLGIAFTVFLSELMICWLVKREKSYRFLKTMEYFLCRS